MFRNYLKVAVRNLLRYRSYTVINIFGLASGLAVFALLWLYINHELSYNTYHSKSDRIYRIYEQYEDVDGGKRLIGATAMAMVRAMASDFPEIEQVAIVASEGQTTVTYGESRFIERDYMVVEKDFFDVFDIEFVTGGYYPNDPDKLGVLITESTARKYFNDVNPIGELLEVNKFGNQTVLGVITDTPSNSDLQVDFIYVTNWNLWPEHAQQYIQSWETTNCVGFLLLNENTTPEALLAKKQAFLDKYMSDESTQRDFYLQPLGDIHLYSGNFSFDFGRQAGDIQYVYIFTIVGFFILLIACVNYMNLATARSLTRMHEVSVRKVVGANRAQLIQQFLIEAILTAFISLLLAIGMVEVALPYFTELSGKPLQFDFFHNWQRALLFLGITAFVGLFSGMVPALILSKFKPIGVLKGRSQTQLSGTFTRKGLVIFQFMLSISMIIATLVVYQQMQYVKTKQLGFNHDNLLVVDINSQHVRRNHQVMKTEFLANPQVYEVAITSRVPGEWKNLHQVEIEAPMEALRDGALSMYYKAFDRDVIPAYQIELVAGNNFSGNDLLDSASLLINEKAAEVMGWDNPIGQEVKLADGSFQGRVIGVVRDFHFQSLYDEIAPLVIGHIQAPMDYMDYFTLRIGGDDIEQTMAHIEKVYTTYDTGNPLEYHFLGEQWGRFYKGDEQRGRIFGIAAALAIIVACLGLFGLVNFTAQQRTKEFGIRKVLGASVAQLVFLMSRDFLSLVAIAFAIAAPIAYLVMGNWLEDFAYRTNIGIDVFLIAGTMAILAALATVLFRSIKTARGNPVESLRYE